MSGEQRPYYSNLDLLDSQLTLNLFNNEDLLTVIRTVANQSNVYTYIGMKSTKEVGHLPLFKLDTWFDPHGIDNILSIAIVGKNYPVALDVMEKILHRPPSGTGKRVQEMWEVAVIFQHGGGGRLKRFYPLIHSWQYTGRNLTDQHSGRKPFLVYTPPIQKDRTG